MGHGPDRPAKTRGPPHGQGGVAHIEPTSRGPRPGPAHQIFRGWAAARPGPSQFQRIGRGPTQPITFASFYGSARPGPIIFFKRLGPARPGPSRTPKSLPGPARHNFRIGPARPGPDKRPMTSPNSSEDFEAEGGACGFEESSS